MVNDSSASFDERAGYLQTEMMAQQSKVFFMRLRRYRLRRPTAMNLEFPVNRHDATVGGRQGLTTAACPKDITIFERHAVHMSGVQTLERGDGRLEGPCVFDPSAIGVEIEGRPRPWANWGGML